MRKFCPLSMASSNGLNDCGDRCMLYNWEMGGCLIKKALTTYIDEHKPFTMKQPTEKELDRLTELLKETLAKHSAEPIIFKHPDLKVKHDYGKDDPMEGLCLVP